MKKTVKTPKKKSLIGQLFKLIKKLFKLVFLPITFVFKLIRYCLRFIATYCWHPIRKQLDILAEQRRIARELAKLSSSHKSDCASKLIEVLGGIDNIVSVKATSRSIYIKVEIEFLLELDELSKFGFVWHELEKGCLTLTLGFQAPLISGVINRYIRITRKPRVRKHSTVAVPKLDFKLFVKKVKDNIIKAKDALLNLKDTLINLQEKAIALYEKKKEEFDAWCAKKKEERRIRKIKRAAERKRRKIERAKQRKAKKLMLAARKKQKLQLQKQKRLKQVAMRKQKVAARMQQEKAKQAARRSKLQAQKAKTQKRSSAKSKTPKRNTKRTTQRRR